MPYYEKLVYSTSGQQDYHQYDVQILLSIIIVVPILILITVGLTVFEI